jgi:hypothetical protein
MFMVQRCSICNHPSRAAIEIGLLERVPYRTLAAKFEVSASALCRHSKHLSRERELRQLLNDQVRQAAIIDKLDLLDHRLDRLFNSALDLRSLNVSLGCIRESLRLISLLDRCRPALADRP